MPIDHKGNTQPAIDQEEHTHVNGIAGKKVYNLDSQGNIVDFGGGFISTKNSTSDTLNAGIAFTGTAEDITEVSAIIISLKASHASATDGLSVQFSPDGTNWDNTDVFTIPAATGKTFSFQPAARWFRVVYTNGGNDQTYFRLQTVFKYTNVKPSSHRIQDAIVDEDDAELTTAVLKAKANGGGFVNIQATASENLRVTDAESGLAIAEGNVTGTTFVHKFGSAPDFDTGDNSVTIWDGANDGGINQMLYVYASAASINAISSSATVDNMSIEIQGLDADWKTLTQTVTLNGQSLVSVPTAYLRVFRMRNISSTDLTGDVYIYENSGITNGVPDTSSVVKAVIQNGNNQTLMATYTIPAGKTGYLRSFFAATGGAKKSTNYIIDLFARPLNQVFQLKHKSALVDTGTSYFQHEYVEPEVFSAQTDIEMRSKITESTISEGTTVGGFDIVLVDN